MKKIFKVIKDAIMEAQRRKANRDIAHWAEVEFGEDAPAALFHFSQDKSYSQVMDELRLSRRFS